MKHKVKVSKWIDGILKHEEVFVDSLDAAKAEVKKHKGHKGQCKIYDENGFLLLIEMLIEELLEGESYA